VFKSLLFQEKEKRKFSFGSSSAKKDVQILDPKTAEV
jgi:hypothetical protein